MVPQCWGVSLPICLSALLLEGLPCQGEGRVEKEAASCMTLRLLTDGLTYTQGPSVAPVALSPQGLCCLSQRVLSQGFCSFPPCSRSVGQQQPHPVRERRRHGESVQLLLWTGRTCLAGAVRIVCAQLRPSAFACIFPLNSQAPRLTGVFSPSLSLKFSRLLPSRRLRN